MNTINYYFKNLTFLIKMNLKRGLEYPAYMLGWFISNPIQFIVGFATIKFVVEQFDGINGWNYGEIAFLYGLAVISHALCMIFFVQFWWLGYAIIEGDLDRMMLRPQSVLFQYITSNLNVVGITDLISGAIVFGYGCYKVNFHWSIKNTLFVILVVIGATLIRGAILILQGSISFWVKSVKDFGDLSQELFDRTTMYPLTMYPKLLQVIFTYVLPFGWISFYPAGSLLNKAGIITTPFGIPVMTLIVGLVSVFVGAVIFKIGTRKYESAGN